MGAKLGRRRRLRLQKMASKIQLGPGSSMSIIEGLTVKRFRTAPLAASNPPVRCGRRVSAGPLGAQIAEQAGAEVDRAGRIKVLPDLTVPGHPNAFVIGDMASVPGVPGMAQGAIGVRSTPPAPSGPAQGAHAPAALREPFHYFDKGSMATVSRHSAVAKVGPLELSGYVAWVAWLALHLVYLVGFKSKIITLISWTTTFLTMRPGPAHASPGGKPLSPPAERPTKSDSAATPHNTMIGDKR